jgi:hypothetical protein
MARNRCVAPNIAAMDLFVVPTIGFDLLYVLVIVRLARRDLVWINVTPRIQGELLKLGFEVAQSSVAKYMVKRYGPPSQGWRAFLRNQGAGFPTPVTGESRHDATRMRRSTSMRAELFRQTVTTNHSIIELSATGYTR